MAKCIESNSIILDIFVISDNLDKRSIKQTCKTAFLHLNTLFRRVWQVIGESCHMPLRLVNFISRSEEVAE